MLTLYAQAHVDRVYAQAHVDRVKDEALAKLNQKEAAAKKKALLNKRKKNAADKKNEAKMEEATHGGHFGELYPLLQDEDPEVSSSCTPCKPRRMRLS